MKRAILFGLMALFSTVLFGQDMGVALIKPDSNTYNLKQQTLVDGKEVGYQPVFEEGQTLEQMKNTLLQLALQTDANISQQEQQLQTAKDLRSSYAVIYQQLAGSPLDTVIFQQTMQELNGVYALTVTNGTKKVYALTLNNGNVTEVIGPKVGKIVVKGRTKITLRNFFTANVNFTLRANGKWKAVSGDGLTHYTLVRKQ